MELGKLGWFQSERGNLLFMAADSRGSKGPKLGGQVFSGKAMRSSYLLELFWDLKFWIIFFIENQNRLSKVEQSSDM